MATSQGNPQQLHASGLVFQKFANGIAGIAKTDLVQAEGGGGEWGVAVADPDVAAGYPDFARDLSQVSNLFTQFLIAAEPQFADAATDLFDCAGDFSKADTPVPSGMTPIGHAPGDITVYKRENPPKGGIGDYTFEQWWVDRNGHVYYQYDQQGDNFNLPPGFVETGPMAEGSTS